MKQPVRCLVRTFRFHHGEMTQASLADAIGVSRQTIISLEKGRYLPSVELALRLARFFGCAVEDLFVLEEDSDA